MRKLKLNSAIMVGFLYGFGLFWDREEGEREEREMRENDKCVCEI